MPPDAKSIYQAKLNKETISDLKKLSEEFDTLGIPKIETHDVHLISPVLEQLMQNSYALIQMYRRKLKEISEVSLSKAKQNTLHSKLNEHIHNYESEIAEKDDEIQKLKHELRKLQSDSEEKARINKTLVAELTQMKAAYKTKLKEHAHTSQQLRNKIESLKEKCGESIGKYKSNDTFISEYLLKYKQREEVYKETISKLQQNNKDLMEEVLNLQHDVLFFTSKNKQENGTNNL